MGKLSKKDIDKAVNEIKEAYKDESINYKKLWFEICEEKKQLQIDNIRLKQDSEYWRKQANKFERFYNEERKK